MTIRSSPPSPARPAPDDWSSKLAQAQGGTLYLKEVAALPDESKHQLFHALQPREVEGHAHPDVRFLMSTSENLLALVEQGRFPQDLYHRLSVLCLKLPPLRHRGTDVEQLADHFRTRHAIEFGKNVVGFTRDALDFLSKYDWPGNVRELEGVVQRCVVLCQGTRITSGHLSLGLGHPRTSRRSSVTLRPYLPMSIRPLKDALAEPEKRIIIQRVPGTELEPPGDRAGARHQPHDALQEDEEVRSTHRWTDLGQLIGPRPRPTTTSPDATIRVGTRC